MSHFSALLSTSLLERIVCHLHCHFSTSHPKRASHSRPLPQVLDCCLPIVPLCQMRKGIPAQGTGLTSAGNPVINIQIYTPLDVGSCAVSDLRSCAWPPWLSLSTPTHACLHHPNVLSVQHLGHGTGSPTSPHPRTTPLLPCRLP